MLHSIDQNRRQLAGNLLEQMLESASIPTSTSSATQILDILHQIECGSPPHQSTNNDFQFGVTEFSVSLAMNRMPTIRCLAEITSRRPARKSDIQEAFSIGHDLFAFLAEQFGVSYPLQTFQDIYRLVYDSIDDSATQPHHRFGLAVEWSQTAPPSVKCYFDLFATGRAHAFTKLHTIFRHLGFEKQWLLIDQVAPELGGREFCRGIGIDFSPVKVANCRLYLAGKHFTIERINGFLETFGSSDHPAAVNKFHRLILNSMWPTEPLSSVLVGLVFSALLPADRALVKLDAYLPDLKPDDQASTFAIRALCSSLGVASDGYDRMLGIVTDHRDLGATQALQQFLSLDLLGGGKTKINAYFRPFGLETPHLAPQHRPRGKSDVVGSVDQSIRRTISWIEGQRPTQYPEAIHRMYFPRTLGFTGRTDLQKGWVFQCALICDALLQAAGSGFEIDWDGITDDIRRLVDARCHQIRGGWKYFPDLPELPPDADDLAIILQLLVRSGYDSIGTLCDDPIRILFEQNSAGDGSFSTWIVDKTECNELTRTMLDAIETKWGNIPDVEVIANLLYALVIYDADRFAAEIALGVEYISGRQKPDGSWHSSWYCGPYSGTFACARAISVAQPQHHSLSGAARFLEGCQRDDGGWGNQETTATDTALALMALICLHGSVAIDAVTIRRAITYLTGHQSPHGTWPRSPFIQMDTNRTVTLAGNSQPQIITYGSQTITSALCLKALSMARPVIRDLD